MAVNKRKYYRYLLKFIDPTSTKDAQLLTVSNETQEQENSASKSFGSITQGTAIKYLMYGRKIHCFRNPFIKIIPINATTNDRQPSKKLIHAIRTSWDGGRDASGGQ